MIAAHRGPQALKVALALPTAGGFAGSLHSRQQQGDENPNCGDAHQHFDERETSAAWTHDEPPLEKK
jgi:hypothetical protein